MRSGKNIFLRRAFFFFIVLGLTLGASVRASAAVYAIHFASYKTIKQAQGDASRLGAQGLDAFVQEADVHGSGKWYRVYVGKFDTRQKASVAAADMKSKKQIETVFIHLLPNVKFEPALKIAVGGTASQATSEKNAVVGNTQTKRYHLPGMPYYDKVKTHHRIFFQSEKEALERGYYKAGTGKDTPKETETETQTQAPQPKKIMPAIAAKLSGAKLDARQIAAKDQAIQKEELKSLMLGDKKVMPPPPALADLGEDKDIGFADPDEMDIVEPTSSSELYNKALGQLKEKQYEQALITFKEFISRDDTSKEWGQRALRHMADCHYWLGKKDANKQELLIAAEFYKNTLTSFPDPRKENALTYYRLAKTYEQLKYYPEAIKQYRNLIAKYPDSTYAPEAYFKIGEVYYIDGKYGQAAESFIQYLMKYRGKRNAKKTYYFVAHSFYKAKQSTNAEIWFRDIAKKWPDLTDMPKEMVLDYGLHKNSMLRYDDAAGAYSFYVNLYPADPKIKEVMMLLAGAYRQAGQIPAALAIYQQIIGKFPEANEAGESMLAMAQLGVDNPGAKVFRGLNNIENYRFPMDTYDELIMKKAVGDIAEKAMLQKSAALVKKGQRRKAADVYLEFLSLYPESKRIAEASRGLKSASTDLIDEYYAKNDYLAVAYVYFRSFGAVALQADEYPQVNKIALSLKELHLMDDHSTLLNKYLKVAKDEQIMNRVSLELAEGLILRGQYDEAEKMLTVLMNKPSVRKTNLLTEIKKNLADIAYRKQQFAQAVSNYGAVVQSGQTIQDPGAVYSHYARSLKEQKENVLALQNYLTAVKYLSAQKREKGNLGIAYKDIGDLYVKNNNLGIGLSMYTKALDNATDVEMKLWSQFLVGETYLKLEKQDQAQNVFAQMKAAAGPEGFWAKVVDFYMADTQWWEKYGTLIKKR